MNITIPDEIFKSTQMSEADIKLELAILLYQQKKISTGQARRLANINLLEFRREIANRNICVNYDVEDFKADLETLKRLGEL